MVVETQFISAEQYSERQKRSAQRILDSLDRGEARLQDHYTQVRNYKRASCRKVIHVRISNPGGEPFAFSVFMRDVSSSGAGFIYPGPIPHDKILIGIPIPGRDDTWFEGVIARRKEFMQEGFWDYGVRFTGRLT
ncbi:MAG TPA: hypothetical protein DD473_05265 [Planctomycetaceae bacterium]|nr:hypothetical protein [Planctomycetaceae bacterium]